MAIQKTAPDYDPEKGCKWSIQQLRQYLNAKHGLKVVSIILDYLKKNKKIILNIYAFIFFNNNKE